MPAELAYPQTVEADSNSLEIVRAWAAHGGLHCALRPDIWPKDKAAIGWGVLLSDLARHVADALAQTYSLDRAQTLNGIRSVFEKELTAPTAETSGELRKR